MFLCEHKLRERENGREIVREAGRGRKRKSFEFSRSRKVRKFMVYLRDDKKAGNYEVERERERGGGAKACNDRGIF